jgi:hypothetical protein
MSDERTQAAYQVRFDWGAVGAAVIGADADAIVWVDQLGEQSVPQLDGVVAGSLQSSAAVAAWSLARQEELGVRFRIAVVAAGDEEPGAGLRFAVEDLFAAGAVIEATAELGIDHQSPEAAAAAAAYRGLQGAMRHLVSASVSARELGKPPIDLAPVSDVVILRPFPASPARPPAG